MAEENNDEEDYIMSVCNEIDPACAEDFGFFHEVGNNYVYPKNYPVRSYQQNIVHTSLFSNTLVSLPTGLGKTFIAAVVMYNYYRWFPNCKVIFTAPTRPLVAQQLDACYNVTGIPKKDTVQMTGNMAREQRILAWKKFRVFFLTPQVLINDLNSGACPSQSIRCIVFDEAHKATKSYAYCQIMNYLIENSCVFRVLALSATPGSDINSVKNVIENLMISKIEFRTEESLDVVPYVHRKIIRRHFLPLSKNILLIQRRLFEVIDKYTRKLKDARILTGNVASLKPFQILKARERFQNNIPSNIPRQAVGSLISDFFVCAHLVHAKELLITYGIKAFYEFLIDDQEKGNVATRLAEDNQLKKIIADLCQMINYPNASFSSHPKMDKLKELALEYFGIKSDPERKLIIFCQYRSVVNEVMDLLDSSHLIRPVMFFGQTGKGHRYGMTQNKQQEVLHKFRNGEFNVLIATSVAEEGLDIGDVDLIICMECGKSPIRLVQRSGRTARHRSGQCVLLLTEKYDEDKFNKCIADVNSYATKVLGCKTLQKSLLQGKDKLIPANVRPEIRFYNFELPTETSGPLAKKRHLSSKNCGDIFKYMSSPKKKKTCQSPASSFAQDTNALEPCEPSKQLAKKRHLIAKNCGDIFKYASSPKKTCQSTASSFAQDTNALEPGERLGEMETPLEQVSAYSNTVENESANNSIKLSRHSDSSIDTDVSEVKKRKFNNLDNDNFDSEINNLGHPRNLNSRCNINLSDEDDKVNNNNNFSVWSRVEENQTHNCCSTTYQNCANESQESEDECGCVFKPDRISTDNVQFMDITNDQDPTCLSPLTCKLIKISNNKVEADCDRLMDQMSKFHITDKVNSVRNSDDETSQMSPLMEESNLESVTPNANVCGESKRVKETYLKDSILGNTLHHSKFLEDIDLEDLFLGDTTNILSVKKQLTSNAAVSNKSRCVVIQYEKNAATEHCNENAPPPSIESKPSSATPKRITAKNSYLANKYFDATCTPIKANSDVKSIQSPSIFEMSYAHKRGRVTPKNSDNAYLINSQSPSLLEEGRGSGSQICSLNDAMLLAYSEDDGISPFLSEIENSDVSKRAKVPPRSLKPIRFSFSSSEDEATSPTCEYSETMERQKNTNKVNCQNDESKRYSHYPVNAKVSSRGLSYLPSGMDILKSNQDNDLLVTDASIPHPSRISYHESSKCEVTILENAISLRRGNSKDSQDHDRDSMKRKRGACKFVITEAEVSPADISSDTTDDDSSLDQMDSSFIDDSDNPEDRQNVSVSMTSRYLQSVKSPCNNRVAKFKIAPLPETQESQCISSQCYYEESQYILDSFVVNQVDNETHSEDELEKAERKLRRQRRRRRHRERKRMRIERDVDDLDFP